MPIRPAAAVLAVLLSACDSGSPDTGTCTWQCPVAIPRDKCVGAPKLGTTTACAVGDPLPARVLTDCCGRRIPLIDVVCGARATVIELGAGWCKECRESAPQLGRWATDYGPRGLAVVSVLKETDSAGSPATASFCACWGADYDATHTVVIDPSDVITTACSGGSLPTTLVVDEDGTIRARVTGARLTEVETAFSELLAP